MRSILLLCAVGLFAPFSASAKEFLIADRDVPALITALQEANRSPGPHVIRLHPGGIYTLELTDSQGLGLPPVRTQVRIEGQHAEIRRYANLRMTLFEVAEGGSAHLLDLTLAEGSWGALRNHGNLVLDRVAVTDSISDGERAILLNYGEMTVRDSLIGYNQINKVGRDSGILINLGQLTLKRSRFVGNSVTRAVPGTAAAGAVLNQGNLIAQAVEFMDNAVADPFGGLAFSAVVNLDNGTTVGLEPQSLLSEIFVP